jgi:hypothetical protein
VRWFRSTFPRSLRRLRPNTEPFLVDLPHLRQTQPLPRSGRPLLSASEMRLVGRRRRKCVGQFRWTPRARCARFLDKTCPDLGAREPPNRQPSDPERTHLFLLRISEITKSVPSFANSQQWPSAVHVHLGNQYEHYALATGPIVKQILQFANLAWSQYYRACYGKRRITHD